MAGASVTALAVGPPSTHPRPTATQGLAMSAQGLAYVPQLAGVCVLLVQDYEQEVD